MLPESTLAQAARLLDQFRQKGWRLATAESCTGGLIAAALTHFAGSSDVLDRGFVTYSNAAKTDLLGVPAAMIEAHGAVSQAVALAMASGAIGHSAADAAVSVTGIAGPGGGTAEKPVGLVWFGYAERGRAPIAHRQDFQGDRASVRAQAVAFALTVLAGQGRI
jgi:nicotinamide-nucleotide amidase